MIIVKPEHRDAVNAAITRFLNSRWSAGVATAIDAAYGEEIIRYVRAIYNSAMNAPVDWENTSMDSALDVLAESLTAQYPWLSDEARTRLNACFIMEWK